MKKNLFGLLGIGLFSIFVGFGGIASADTPENCFEFNSGTNTIIGYHGTGANCGADVVVPGTINGKVVKKIGTGAFLKRTTNISLTSIVLPDSIEEIGEHGIKENKITTLRLPSSLKKIGHGGLQFNDLLSSLIIPEGIQELDMGMVALMSAPLVSVNLPDSLNKVTGDGFCLNGNKTLTGYVSWDPNDVANKTKKEALEGTGDDKTCLKLVQKTDPTNFVNLKSIEKIANTEITVENGTEEVDAKGKLPKKGNIKDDKNKIHEVDLTWTIKDYDKNNAGEYIATGTFDLPSNITNTSNLNLEYTGKVTVKAYNCFEFNSATKTITEYHIEKPQCGTDVVIPSSIGGVEVQHIKEHDVFYKNGTFSGSLTSVSIPGTIKEIKGRNTFAHQKITKVVLGEGIEKLGLGGGDTFADNHIKSVDLPDSLISLGNGLFRGQRPEGNPSGGVSGCTTYVTGYVNWDPATNKDKKKLFEGTGSNKNCVKLVYKERIIEQKDSTSSGSVTYSSSIKVIVTDGVISAEKDYNAINEPVYSTTQPADFTGNNTTVKGVLTLTFNGGDHAIFSKPMKIKMPVDSSKVYVKVNHGNGFGTEGLSLNQNITCNNGEPNNNKGLD